jgi:hypothetical protein
MEGNLAAFATQGINLSIKAIRLARFTLEGKYTNIFGI